MSTSLSYFAQISLSNDAMSEVSSPLPVAPASLPCSVSNDGVGGRAPCILSRTVTRFAPLLLILLSTGCNVVGYAAYAIGGPDEIKARYMLERKPTLVLAENFNDSTETIIDGGQFEEVVAREITAGYLKKNKSEDGPFPFIDTTLARQIPTTRPLVYAKMSIPQIARETGAQQVLYINIAAIDSAFAQGSNMGKGKGTARVKVVDANTGATLWPLDAASGYPITYQTALTNLGEGVSPSTVRRAVRVGLAQAAARLFYDFKPES